jgi:hypothetical protein
MAIRKVRCRQCQYKNNKGNEYPCNNCKEIQLRIYFNIQHCKDYYSHKI